MIEIRIASQFTTTPGPRTKDEGAFSGQQFREEFLVPMYLKAREQGTKLLIDLDGTEGYATSFLEEAFGGLARLYDPQDILETLQLKCEDEPYSIEEIRLYIVEARKR